MKIAIFAQCQIEEILAQKHHYLCVFSLPNEYVAVGVAALRRIFVHTSNDVTGSKMRNEFRTFCMSTPKQAPVLSQENWFD
jgi:hypothetical protein